MFFMRSNSLLEIWCFFVDFFVARLLQGARVVKAHPPIGGRGELQGRLEAEDVPTVGITSVAPTRLGYASWQ